MSSEVRAKIIARVWTARADRYSEARAGLVQIEGRERERMEMYQIGR